MTKPTVVAAGGAGGGGSERRGQKTETLFNSLPRTLTGKAAPGSSLANDTVSTEKDQSLKNVAVFLFFCVCFSLARTRVSTYKCVSTYVHECKATYIWYRARVAFLSSCFPLPHIV